jgi:RNA-directed DNA polymerase
MKIQLLHTFEDIISVENLLLAWRGFIKGKRGKADVQDFYARLMPNLFDLHEDLAHHTYKHDGYQAFNISDPKPRSIHKATVRDRLLHHAIYRVLYPFFHQTFIADSFSCRVGKGTHRALGRFQRFAYKVSRNHTRTSWVLKCDIRKFFANIDHAILLELLGQYIPDQDVLWLMERIIGSFHAQEAGVGLPLGNLTSQLFVNVYMNEFDQFAKHKLKARHYIRYADDFALLSEDRAWLEAQVPQIESFLRERLHLTLHPDKVYIKTFASGVDFLGWVHFPDHRVLRTTTKKRLLRKIVRSGKEGSIASCLGVLNHGNTQKIRAKICTDYRSNIV